MLHSCTIFTKDLPPGRQAWVFPLLFGRARLGVGPAQGDTFDDLW